MAFLFFFTVQRIIGFINRIGRLYKIDSDNVQYNNASKNYFKKI